MIRALILSTALLALSGCSVFDALVYKIDIPQGNYIDQKQVDKLRKGMTQEQVSFVLGTPMSNNPFDHSRWNYIYRYKTGKGELIEKSLIAYFDEQQQLAQVTGDYELSAQFEIPVDQDLPDMIQAQDAADDAPAEPEAPENSGDLVRPGVDIPTTTE